MTIFSHSPTPYRPKSYFGAGSIEVAPPARAGEGGVRRLATHKDALLTEPAPGVQTIPDLIDYAEGVHGVREAVGWREVLGVHEETKKGGDDEGKEGKEKTWTYLDLGAYQWISYTEFWARVEDVARGLVELGIGKEDVVGLFAETSANWQLISSACARISTPIATAYDTLGAPGLTHALNEPTCAAVFTNPALLPTALQVLPDTPSVRFVFYDGTPSEAEEEALAQIRNVRSGKVDDDADAPKVRTMHVSALRALGASLSDPGSGSGSSTHTIPPDRRPTPSSTACIMYTSGSTGAPKGVVLTHANLLASVGAVHAVFRPHLGPQASVQPGQQAPSGSGAEVDGVGGKEGGDGERVRYIAYLPLAHVLEYVVELCALFSGVGMGYARARTLTGRGIWQSGAGRGSSNADGDGDNAQAKEVRGTGRGDLEELQPDILLGVPAVWETVRKAAEARLAHAPVLARQAFGAAMAVKGATEAVASFTTTSASSASGATDTNNDTEIGTAGGPASTLKALPNALTHAVQHTIDGVLDATVLRPVKAALGGRVRLALNGGAAVGAETQAWFVRVGVPLVQGYGLTETCGMCAFLPPELLSIGPVGLPAPSVEIKLVDCPESKELGYEACPAADSKDADGDPVRPQGEIWIRGPSVTKGYFKRQDLNVVANEDGSLPSDSDAHPDNDDDEKMEKAEGSKGNESGKEEKDTKTTKPDPVFTRDGWFRTGDVGRWNADGTLSIVDRLKNLVKLQGGEYIALERLEAIYKSCSLVGNMCLYANGDMTQPIAIVVSPKPGSGSGPSKDDILHELAALAKKNGLSKMETPSRVVVGQEEWTPENGYVTAAQKVQRGKVAEGFKDEIEECKKAQKSK